LSHPAKLFLGVLAVVLSVVDFTPATAALTISCLLAAGAAFGATACLRHAWRRGSKVLAGIETLLFLAATALALLVVVDISYHSPRTISRTLVSGIEQPPN
jgi:hypothetical protein